MTAQHFLEKHPTPWRFIRETDLSDLGVKAELIADGYHDARQCAQEVRDVVEDANGNIVFASWDRDETASHIDGDVRALVDFVNLVGEDYEPQHGWAGPRPRWYSLANQQRVWEMFFSPDNNNKTER